MGDVVLLLLLLLGIATLVVLVWLGHVVERYGGRCVGERGRGDYAVVNS